MWRVQQVTTQRVCLDFSSSGQGKREVTQILADGMVLANAVELTDWKAAGAQIIVCKHCGIEQCEPGGWVAPRWTGSHVVLLPDFSGMAEDESARSEYRPPEYFGARGIPVLEEELAKAIPAFHRPHELPAITGRDLVRAIQWTAPMNVLGRFPKPACVRREDVVATSEPDLGAALDQLDAEFIRLQASGEGLVLDQAPRDAQPVAIYLDDPGATEWVSGYVIGSKMILGLASDLLALPGASQ